MPYYILKNKDDAVLKVKMEGNVFTEVTDVYTPELLPFGVKDVSDFLGVHKEEVSVSKLSKWWKNSSIPVERDSIRLGLECLGITDTEQLRIMGLGLSLNNHYWLEPEGASYKWADINYFQNDFSPEMGIALFNHKSIHPDKIGRSPDAALNGQLEKKWVIDGGARVLVKKGEIRTVNEVLASDLAKELGMDTVSYSLAVENNNITCRCNCFTDDDWEFILGTDILREFPQPYGKTSYEHYVDTLEALGVPDAKEHTDKMICLDYILRNTDRHYNNLGVLYNREKNEYKVAPVFDSGESMHHGNLEINNASWDMRPFSHTGSLFEPAEEHIKNASKRYSIDEKRLEQYLEKYAYNALKYDLASEKRLEKIIQTCIARNREMQREKERESLVSVPVNERFAEAKAEAVSGEKRKSNEKEIER